MLIGDTEVWNTVASESLDLQDGFLAGRVGAPLVEHHNIRRGKHRTHETEALLLSGRNIHTAPSDPHADYRSRRVGRSAGGRKRACRRTTVRRRNMFHRGETRRPRHGAAFGGHFPSPHPERKGRTGTSLACGELFATVFKGSYKAPRRCRHYPCSFMTKIRPVLDTNGVSTKGFQH